MASLDDLYRDIPTAELADKFGVDHDTVDDAVHTLVPALLNGLHHNVDDPAHAATIESAATAADSGTHDDGHQAISALFGGGDGSDKIAAALGQQGHNSDLIKQLLPMVLPIVLSYIGKQLGANQGSSAPAPGGSGAQGGGLGEILGSILSSGKSDSSLGGVLGSVLGGKGGGGLGEVLGGLLGGKK